MDSDSDIPDLGQRSINKSDKGDESDEGNEGNQGQGACIIILMSGIAVGEFASILSYVTKQRHIKLVGATPKV